MPRIVALNSYRDRFFSLAYCILLVALLTAVQGAARGYAQDTEASLKSPVDSTHANRAGKKVRAAGERMARRLMLMMDTDKNGAVSKDEFLEFMSQTFDRLDANKNNQLEREELRQLDDPNWIICHDMRIC
jgi:hypothetical protein